SIASSVPAVVLVMKLMIELDREVDANLKDRTREGRVDSSPLLLLSFQLRFRVDPRTSVWAMQQAIGFVVAHHHLFRGVPIQRTAELHREVRKNAARGRDVALFDVGYGLASLVDGGEEIRPVVANRGGDVAFQVLLGLVL